MLGNKLDISVIMLILQYNNNLYKHMSKSSTRQKVTQLKEWLKTLNTGSNSSNKPRKFSKADHYNKVNNKYGGKKSN